MTIFVIFIYASQNCINSALFIFFNLYYFNIFSLDSDDGSPEEFTNVYKLSREEYFWNMYNSSSFSECWEILKEGVTNRQTSRQTGRLFAQHVLKYLSLHFLRHSFYFMIQYYFFSLLCDINFTTTGYNNSLCCIQCNA